MCATLKRNRSETPGAPAVLFACLSSNQCSTQLSYNKSKGLKFSINVPHMNIQIRQPLPRHLINVALPKAFPDYWAEIDLAVNF